MTQQRWALLRGMKVSTLDNSAKAEKRMKLLPIARRSSSTQRLIFQLKEGGPRLRGWGTAASIATISSSVLSCEATRTRRGI
jgi:hypothetical protein